MSSRASIYMLLSNYACDVAQGNSRQLYFRCRGLVVTGFFLLWSVVAVLALVAFVLLSWHGGAEHETMGLTGSIMAISLAVWSTHLAVVRYRRHGRFELDGEEGVLRHYRGARMVNEFRIRQINRVWLAIDATDTVRMEQPPSWLQVRLDSGEIFRLAKGSPVELEPVCDVMRDMGLAPG